jgi:hypothetical protein
MNADEASNSRGLFGSRHNSPDVQWAGIQSNARCFTKSSSTENIADSNQSSGVTRLLKLKQNTASLDNVVNGSTVSQDLTVVDGESINNTTPSNDFRVATYFDNTVGRRYNGKAAEFRIKRSKDSADYDEAEHNNQSDPSAFWSTSAWEEQGGGVSASVTESYGDFTESINGSIDFNVSISITESYGDFTETITATVTQDVNVTASITESNEDFTESVTVTVIEPGQIAVSITESYADFTESINAQLDTNVFIAITELNDSFSESVSTNVTGEVLAQVTESYADFIDSINVSFPVVVTVNPRNTLRINKQDNRVIIKKTNNAIKVK